MPTDFSDRPDPNDSPMFAPIPAWERNKKRRGFGRSARSAARPDATVAETIADEPRSFAGESAAAGMGAGAMGASAMGAERMDYVDPTETTFAGTPAYATRTTTRRSNGAPLAIAAGIILVGGLAAAGWYATQPHGQGVAELTPGAPGSTTTTTDTAAAAPPLAPSQMAANTPPPMPEPARAAPARTTTRTTVTHHVARGAGRSAEDVGVNAAATIPARPQAYAPSAQAPAPAPAPAPTLTPAPTQAAPAPAPTPPVDTAPATTPPSPSPTPQPGQVPPQ
jgi:hypothetical protein